MGGRELLEKLLSSYESAFDIKRPYSIGENTYNAYAEFYVTSAKYVLVKSAELWRAHCFEHTFFVHKDELILRDIENFYTDIITYVEPHLVLRDKKCTDENHMYTYITGIFISESRLSEEVKKAIHKFIYFKNYRMGLRGYAQARVLIFDMEAKNIAGNRAAGELIKGYKKIF